MTVVSSTLTPVSSVATIVTNQATLTAGVTLEPPVPAIPQAIFIVQLSQNGTGGYPITFDAFYLGLSTLITDKTANTQLTIQVQINIAGDAGLCLILANGQTIA